jgi:HK97 family phage major capsid protein
MELKNVLDKLDSLAGDFAAYRAAQDERVKQIEQTGKASAEIVEKMAKLETSLGQLDEVKAEAAELKSRLGDLETAGTKPGKVEDAAGPYKSFGEQLKDAVAVETRQDGWHNAEAKLRTVKAATGLSEGVAADGGFLVQQDYVNQLMKRTYEIGAISSRVKKLPISTNANSLRVPGVNETSRADGSRSGGIQAYWVDEAGTKTASKPAFRIIELNLHKLVGMCYATEELLQDAAALEAFIMQIFPEELNYTVENAYVRGTGAGQPLGILNSGATVSVAAEVGQAAATIVSQNVMKMWSRMWARSRPNAVWFINQDIEPQLMQMSIGVGTGGQAVYMPAGGLNDSPYGKLFGRPVVPVEYCSTLGTVGDIILADWSQYLVADKGGIQTASSMHVRFVYDEMVFRFVYRVDGQPMWNSALTPANGTNTLSTFLTLATRP